MENVHPLYVVVILCQGFDFWGPKRSFLCGSQHVNGLRRIMQSGTFQWTERQGKQRLTLRILNKEDGI